MGRSRKAHATIDFEEEERRALRAIFSIFDADDSGFINTTELEAILEKLGRDPSEAESMLVEIDPDRSGTLSFEEFLELVRSTRKEAAPGDDIGPDPKVLEFLSILEQYRLKCEMDGEYMEAERASKQLALLRKQEAKRQHKALRSRQLAEKHDVLNACSLQFSQFNAAWDKYLDEYDVMAQMYIQGMTERHAVKLREFQEKLQKEILAKPPKFSRELLDWRKRQTLLARQGNYAGAQKIKRIADMMEEKERKKLSDGHRSLVSRKEAKFRQQQQAELQALLKRIDVRRREHLKKRELDGKRLLLRNRNRRTALEARQSTETSKVSERIKLALAPPSRRPPPLHASFGPRRTGGGSPKRRPRSRGSRASGSRSRRPASRGGGSAKSSRRSSRDASRHVVEEEADVHDDAPPGSAASGASAAPLEVGA
eukprot:PLAT4751.1.p1 GENE.PLAT4751.1~~PLAT4751.1.p1  ORF type:complete len:427 (+),score=234.09 PLAT4751.1:131-1411(+)